MASTVTTLDTMAGALYGEPQLPREWLAMLRRADVLEKLAVQLLDLSRDKPQSLSCKPGAAAPHPATGA